MVMMILNALKNFVAFLVILFFLATVVFFLAFGGKRSNVPVWIGGKPPLKTAEEKTTEQISFEFQQRLSDIKRIQLDQGLFESKEFIQLQSFKKDPIFIDSGVANPFGRLGDTVSVPAKK